MIFAYLLSAIIALVVYAFTPKLGINIRVMLALLIFAIIATSVTMVVVKIGDKAAPGSVIIYPEKER
jgi:membrane-bound acyltransferase YfiQ involved in biofilm formation